MATEPAKNVCTCCENALADFHISLMTREGAVLETLDYCLACLRDSVLNGGYFDPLHIIEYQGTTELTTT